MNKRLISVLMILIMTFSVGLPAASATQGMLDAYKLLFTDGTCQTCHVKANPTIGDSALNTYGMKVNAECNKQFRVNCPNIPSPKVENRKKVLGVVGPAPGDKPLPELSTIVLFGVSLVGLLALVRYRKK